MAIIVRAYSELDGAIAEASSINKVIDDLYTLQNGNINSANIAPLGVGDSNIQTSSVITAMIDNSAVTADKIANESINSEKLEYTTMIAIKEVF
jgi:hypothetical protein